MKELFGPKGVTTHSKRITFLGQYTASPASDFVTACDHITTYTHFGLCATVPVWRSEGNFLEWFFFFLQEISVTGAQIICMAARVIFTSPVLIAFLRIAN